MPTLKPPYTVEGLPDVERAARKIGGANQHVTPVIGALESNVFTSGTTGWRIDGDGDVEFNSGTFRGTLEASQIHIPNDETDDAFHVDSSGNMWISTISAGNRTLGFGRLRLLNDGSLTMYGDSGGTIGLSIIAGNPLIGFTSPSNLNGGSIQFYDLTSGTDDREVLQFGTAANAVSPGMRFLTRGDDETAYPLAQVEFGETEEFRVFEGNYTGDLLFYAADGVFTIDSHLYFGGIAGTTNDYITHTGTNFEWYSNSVNLMDLRETRNELWVRAGNVDGGLVIGEWVNSSNYTGIFTNGQQTDTATGKEQEYLLLTNGTNTYISCSDGGTVYIRPDANATSVQMAMNSSNTTFTGGVVIPTISGDTSVTGDLNLSSGSAAAPSLTFNSDTNTGFYYQGADAVGFGGAGTRAMTFQHALDATAANWSNQMLVIDDDRASGDGNPGIGFRSNIYDHAAVIRLSSSTTSTLLVRDLNDANPGQLHALLTTSSYSDGTRPSTNIAAGCIIFNTSDNTLNVWDGTAWRDMSGSTT